MAFASVISLRRHNHDLPVIILGQDYICGLDWRGLATVRSMRAAGTRGTPGQWFNKLSALLRSPFEETIYLDCDIVLLADPEPWFDYLGTDDFTCFQYGRRWDEVPDQMEYNLPNPHRMREEFGVDSVPVIDGCGHYFWRATDRGRKLVMAVAEVMNEALDDSKPSIYRRVAGDGNIPASDELAASIVAVREGINLPATMPPPRKCVGVYLPPWQEDGIFDLENNLASYRDVGLQSRITPEAVHFCYNSKWHPSYQAFIKICLERHG